MARHNVIIGGGPAGLNAIETIRALEGGEPSITLISDEPAYSRMVLPYFIAREIPEEQVYVGSEEYFDRLGVDTKWGQRVAHVYPGDHKLALEDGPEVTFDNLLIATGSSAERLNIPGADLRGVSTLWTLNDAHEALDGTPEDAEVVFIGAGFIGFIVLNAMKKRGWKLTVIELEDQVLPRMLDARSAGLVQKWLEARGVRVVTGAMVDEVGPRRDGRKAVCLADGREFPADRVIMATGIRANTDLVKGSSIKTRQGILVNDRLQTNFPNIYAAGDMAEGPDLLTGEQEIHAIQPTAVDHGRVAGANMAGREVRYPGSLVMNVLDVVGLHCASFGHWQSNGREEQVLVNGTRPLYRKIVWEDDRLVGAIFAGPVTDTTLLNDVGMVKGFIQTQTPLGDWKKHLEKYPLDLRRPYVACQVAGKLLEQTTLGHPSKTRSYRHRNLQPWTPPSAAHRVLVRTRPEVMPEPGSAGGEAAG